MIKAIIFDVGGVLLRTHDHTPRRRLESEHGLDEWESERLVFSGKNGVAAQRGEITDAELWGRIASELELTQDELVSFRNAFWAGDRLDHEIVDYIRELQAAGYQTAIISNATDNLRRQLEQFDITAAFDLIVCSAEEKVMKPDLDIYRRTLRRLGRAPDEAVFIDDSKPNVDAARTLGIHAIHFHEGIDMRQALAQLGVTTEMNETNKYPPSNLEKGESNV